MLTSTNIAPNGLKNNDPYWKFVLGFNHETAGSYSDLDVAILNNNVKELEVIKERIFTSPLKLAKLFYRKIETFWLNTNMDWSFSYLKDKSINILGITLSITNIVNILANLNNKIMLILYIFLIFGVYKYINKKNYNKNIIILINQVFVTFGVYLLIEVQPRYSYHIAINVAILASLGITEAINLIKKYQKNNGGKRNDKSNDNIWNKTRSNKNGSTC